MWETTEIWYLMQKSWFCLTRKVEKSLFSTFLFNPFQFHILSKVAAGCYFRSEVIGQEILHACIWAMAYGMKELYNNFKAISIVICFHLQSQYRYVTPHFLLLHLDENMKNTPQIKRSMVGVLKETVAIAADGAVGRLCYFIKNIHFLIWSVHYTSGCAVYAHFSWSIPYLQWWPHYYKWVW